MNANAECVTNLLHLTRKGTPITVELAAEIARTLAASSPEEVAHGTAAFFRDLLDAKQQVLAVQRDALLAVQRDHGPVH